VTPRSEFLQNYVNGQFVRGPREFPDINPADGSVIAQVSEAGESLVNQAVESARRALTGDWGKLTVPARAPLLHKIADGIEARFNDFVEAEVADTGKPISLASKIDIPRGAANFRIFADLVKAAGIEAFRT
jgi:aminomuconate-semialdehyde/2-hydroxymuconate-6-semialdehyde dehydrogenase